MQEFTNLNYFHKQNLPQAHETVEKSPADHAIEGERAAHRATQRMFHEYHQRCRAVMEDSKREHDEKLRRSMEDSKREHEEKLRRSMEDSRREHDDKLRRVMKEHEERVRFHENEIRKLKAAHDDKMEKADSAYKAYGEQVKTKFEAMGKELAKALGNSNKMQPGELEATKAKLETVQRELDTTKSLCADYKERLLQWEKIRPHATELASLRQERDSMAKIISNHKEYIKSMEAKVNEAAQSVRDNRELQDQLASHKAHRADLDRQNTELCKKLQDAQAKLGVVEMLQARCTELEKVQGKHAEVERLQARCEDLERGMASKELQVRLKRTEAERDEALNSVARLKRAEIERDEALNSVARSKAFAGSMSELVEVCVGLDPDNAKGLRRTLMTSLDAVRAFQGSLV